VKAVDFTEDWADAKGLPEKGWIVESGIDPMLWEVQPIGVYRETPTSDVLDLPGYEGIIYFHVEKRRLLVGTVPLDDPSSTVDYLAPRRVSQGELHLKLETALEELNGAREFQLNNRKRDIKSMESRIEGMHQAVDALKNEAERLTPEVTLKMLEAYWGDLEDG